MVGKKDRSPSLFSIVPGDLIDFIPQDHILRRLDRVLDLSWVTNEVRDRYCPDNGAPSIDPEVVLRLLIVGYLFNIPHIRELLREVQVNLAMRWFIRYGLDERLPDHSSLSKITDRWGEEHFKRIYQRVVQLCVASGLVDGKKVHIDATLIRADVSWRSLQPVPSDPTTPAGADAEDAGPAPEQEPVPRKRGRPRTRPAKLKKRSSTDPDASLATSSHDRRLEPCFKDHVAVDDKAGVIVDVAVTTGEASEGEQLLAQIDRVEANTGVRVEVVTADAGYAHPKNYRELEARKIAAIIPPQREMRNVRRLPLRQFKYDAKHEIVRCPQGKILRRSYETTDKRGWVYRARACDCRHCPRRARCVSEKESSRTVMIVNCYEALLRARRRKAKGWDEATQELYDRHRWRSEGKHAEAKERHGLRRATRRGRAKVAIQAYLTAIVMNLKLLAGLLVAFMNWLIRMTEWGAESPSEPASGYGSSQDAAVCRRAA